MHFVPFNTLNDNAVWIITSAVNMQNFSAAVPLPAAPPADNIDDILETLQSLATYGSEYYSSVLCELIDTLVNFTKQRLRRLAWEQADLVLVVYWINTILESFRVELERGSSDGSQIKLRCNEADADFRQIQIHIQQRQIKELQPALSATHPKRSSTPAKPSSNSQHLDSSQRRVQRVVKSEHSLPADVYTHLPVQDGKILCLRFLSNVGCKANNGKSCLSIKRSHYVPEKLHQVIRDFISERFGGLKLEHASL